MDALLRPRGPFASALDFGAGDGWFTDRVRSTKLATDVVGIDVVKRAHNVVEPLIYSGDRIPFEDRTFDLVYAVDVLHHVPDPRRGLADLARCSRQWMLLKDHTYSSRFGFVTLSVLDEIGNRRFGVPSIYRYQRGWEWLPFVESQGFRLEKLIHPLACAGLPLGRITNHLQFVALWKRV
jgi:SAM-dependent methyltransferase